MNIDVIGIVIFLINIAPDVLRDLETGSNLVLVQYQETKDVIFLLCESDLIGIMEYLELVEVNFYAVNPVDICFQPVISSCDRQYS